MALPPSYSGKGLQAPRTEGRALQALSQFGHQEQVRKTQEIQQGVRDRDQFAKMLEMDPVYATSQGLQKGIATAMDQFIDEMTSLNQQRRGSLSTEDLVKMQQSRGRVMAQMGMLKSIDNEMVNSGQMVNTNPSKFDQDFYNEAVQYVQANGQRPPQGFLAPARRLVSEMFEEYPMQQPYGTDTREEGGQIITDKIPEDNEYVNDQVRAERAIQLYRTDPMVGRNVQLEYDALDENSKAYYDETARGLGLRSGAEAYAGDQGVKHMGRGSRIPWRSTTQRKQVANQPDKMAEKTYMRGNTQVINNKDAFTKGTVRGSVLAKDGADGITFRNPSVMNVPARLLKFSADLNLPEEASVKVRPDIAADGKVEFVIDRTDSGKTGVTLTEDEYWGLSTSQQNKYKPVEQADGSFLYEADIPIPKNITAIGSIEEIGHRFDPLVIEKYNEWFPQNKKSKNRLPKFMQWGKEDKATEPAPSSSNKYGI